MFLSARRTSLMLRSSRRLGRTVMAPVAVVNVDPAKSRRHVVFASVSFSTNPNPAANVTTVALLRETYDSWERRAPLTPLHVQELVQQYHHHHHPPLPPQHNVENTNTNNNIRVLVQPSGRRIFPDQAYAQAGALIQDDVSQADIVIGVKRPVDSSTLMADKTYMFFSHTIKGQAENMGLLRDVLDKNIQLMDYECLKHAAAVSTAAAPKEEIMSASTVTSTSTSPTTSTPGSTQSPLLVAASTQKTKRLVSFGRFAGMAGMVDTFHALGRRLLYRDDCSSTPFLSCPVSIMHDTVEQAKDRVLWMGDRIFHEGLAGSGSGGGGGGVEPLVFTVTGQGGAVHEGVMEILQLLPHEVVSVADLPDLMGTTTGGGRGGPGSTGSTGSQHQIYILPVGISDVFEKVSGYAAFDREDFAKNPQDYRSVFCDRVAPYTQVLMNCGYWDARFPRLLTKRDMKRLAEEGKDRLMLVSDISCDVHGSVEFLERTTSIERPFFQYDPITGREVSDGIGNSGVTVMGVDILPTEFPRESSEHFGNAVVGVVKELAGVKQRQNVGAGIDTKLLAPHLADAFITTVDGKLEDGFRYLEFLMKRVPRMPLVSEATMIVSLEGHLFDSGLINQILDILETNKCGMGLEQCVFPQQSKNGRSKSSVLLRITSSDEAVLSRVESKIATLVDVIEKAEAAMVRLDHGRTAGQHSPASVQDLKKEKKVLLLGAGRVSKSLVDFLGRSGDKVITVAAENDDDARDVASVAEKGRHVSLDVQNDVHRLSELIAGSDMVISLLPAPMHAPVAAECIIHKKDFVTASYESEAMRAMNDRARDVGIIMLNEVGLDPGLDHMSAMKIVDDIKSRGGTVTCFSSVCGGLPAPEAADNPLKYKFSWSPKGVITASQNDARYRWEGNLMEVRGSELLQAASPFVENWPDLNLECLPNRDSLKYENIYSIEGADTVFRGTLRYGGFSSLFNVFRNMGLFDETVIESSSWEDVVDMLRKKRGGFVSVEDFVQACADDDLDEARRAIETLEWLGILGNDSVWNSRSIVDAFCDVLESKLQYEHHERDMVAMHHKIEASFDDGSVERHSSSLQVFGDANMSAMSKTVGYTTGAAADLILSGSLRGERGLLLPTVRKIYEPVLAAVDLEGISFEESVNVSPQSMHQEG